MHTIVRKYVKTGFFFLCFGLLTGLYMVVGEYLLPLPVTSLLVTAHTHIILVGFMMMMILGVAQWMFPRPRGENPAYSPAVAEFVFYSITIGISIRSIGEIISAFLESQFFIFLIVIGSVIEVIAIFMFFINIWSRIRPVGSQIREAAGEKF